MYYFFTRPKLVFTAEHEHMREHAIDALLAVSDRNVCYFLDSPRTTVYLIYLSTANSNLQRDNIHVRYLINLQD